MLRDWLGGWLRRLANRISAPRSAAATSAQFAFNVAASKEDWQRDIARQARMRHFGRP